MLIETSRFLIFSKEEKLPFRPLVARPGIMVSKGFNINLTNTVSMSITVACYDHFTPFSAYCLITHKAQNKDILASAMMGLIVVMAYHGHGPTL